MLELIQDFFAAVANNFTQPDAAVHCDEKGALSKAGWLGVDDDVRINQIVPDFCYLSFATAAFHAQIGEHTRQHVAGRASAKNSGFLERRKISSPPLCEHPLA